MCYVRGGYCGGAQGRSWIEIGGGLVKIPSPIFIEPLSLYCTYM